MGSNISAKTLQELSERERRLAVDDLRSWLKRGSSETMSETKHARLEGLVDGYFLKNESPRHAMSSEERILLFEWHASHFKSWIEHLMPNKLEINLLYGVPTEEFHRRSMMLALLRKFYDPKDEVCLKHLATAMREVQVGDDPRFLEDLNDVINSYRYALDGRVSFRIGSNRSELRTEDFFYEITYGLLIHADPGRGARLRDIHKGTVHHGAFLSSPHRLVLSGLLTVQEKRADGTLPVGKPYEPLWTPGRDETEPYINMKVE